MNGSYAPPPRRENRAKLRHFLIDVYTAKGLKWHEIRTPGCSPDEVMDQPNRNRRLTIALYVNAALLGAILVALLARGGPPSMLPAAYAQNQLPIGGGAGVFLVPAQF